jgi:hypothetical protein
MEAEWGYTSRGKFRGFKLHAAVNQYGLPLRAIVTRGNKFDGPFLPELIEDLEANYVLADGAYCSRRNFKAVRDMGGVQVIADNPRKKGKSRKIESDTLLKNKRYVIEQFNYNPTFKQDVLNSLINGSISIPLTFENYSSNHTRRANYPFRKIFF